MARVQFRESVHGWRRHFHYKYLPYQWVKRLSLSASSVAMVAGALTFNDLRLPEMPGLPKLGLPAFDFSYRADPAAVSAKKVERGLTRAVTVPEAETVVHPPVKLKVDLPAAATFQDRLQGEQAGGVTNVEINRPRNLDEPVRVKTIPIQGLKKGAALPNDGLTPVAEIRLPLPKPVIATTKALPLAPPDKDVAATPSFEDDFQLAVRAGTRSALLTKEDLRPKPELAAPVAPPLCKVEQTIATFKYKGRKHDKIDFFWEQSEDIIDTMGWDEDSVIAYPDGCALTLGELAKHSNVFMLPDNKKHLDQFIAAINKFGFKPHKVDFDNLAIYKSLPAAQVKILKQVLPRLHRQESGGIFWSISFAGAQGAMQFMPATAALPSIKLGNAFDPAEAAEASAKLMVQNLNTFGGDIRKAVAAYSTGPGNVMEAVRIGGKNYMAHLHPETQGHSIGILGSFRKSEVTQGPTFLQRIFGVTAEQPEVKNRKERRAKAAAERRLKKQRAHSYTPG